MARAAAALLAALTLLASVPARADGTDEARSHFTHGVDLFKEGDFRAALIEFQRAYEAAPNYKVLYNLGQTSYEMQDYAGALKAFRGYLDGGGSQIPPARRAQVEGDIRKLETRVARVAIVVNVEGADISIDDVSVGKSPLQGPVLVSEGRRKISANKPGLNPVTRVVDVAGGDKPRIQLELAQPQAPPPPVVTVQQPVQAPPPAAEQPVKTASGPSTGFYVSLAVTGALAVGTAILGGVALADYGTYQDRLGQVGVQKADVDRARSATQGFALATDIVGVCAIAGAITTVVLALTTNSKHPVQEKTSLVIGPGAIGLVGSF